MTVQHKLSDYLFRGELADYDPHVAELIGLEAERQIRRLIMIPSSSTIPWMVRQALTSPFHNIYAEGYPDEDTRTLSEEEIMDVDTHIAHYRRYSDPRYYKGTEFANLIEALARRRGAELYATAKTPADKLFVNVQPLSGAPVNSAVYTALIQPGDTIMGLDLLHGGHLSHGSPVARSGKTYNATFYGVQPDTELLDYDNIRELALKNRPKILIAGFTSYPYMPDWTKFRQIADEVGALLLADISHISGLVAAETVASPVGVADIVTFTTHKTLGGPRAAMMITHKADLAKKLDRGVFPGEQGGPHMNTVAALAVALKLATTQEFRDLQAQTIANAVRLAEQLTAHGIRVCHGGTDTHMLTVDLKPLKGRDGTSLSGDMAARILDLIGITANRNTLPGDTTAGKPSGMRFGTPWITQRGFREPEIDRLAEVIATTLKQAQPFAFDGKGGKQDPRAKVTFEQFSAAQTEVASLCDEAGIDYDLPVMASLVSEKARQHFAVWELEDPNNGPYSIEICGKEAANFLNHVVTGDVLSLDTNRVLVTDLLNPDGSVLTSSGLQKIDDEEFILYVTDNGPKIAAWLQALSDGFVVFDTEDIYAKIPGPVLINLTARMQMPTVKIMDRRYAYDKPYFIGRNGDRFPGDPTVPLTPFTWSEPLETGDHKRTNLYDLHLKLGAKIVPFAGYDMPVWYKNVSSEHTAVRTGAGVFDVTHMGVWDVQGAQAESFLNGLTSNDVSALAVGDAHYSYLLGVDGTPLDDIYVYRLHSDRFMIVVNASNNDKDLAWAESVRRGDVLIDPAQPGAKLLTDPDQVTIRDLRAEASDGDRRVDVALQGPKSRDILLALGASEADKARVTKLGWSSVTTGTFGGFDLIISRTGYTGERVAYELFVHPDQAVALFEALINAGATPCGLAARDSLRTEAGLPLYGHELGGDLKLMPSDAGFASYVKLWKPFFIGKQAYIEREAKRDAVVTRFRMDNKSVRPPQPGTSITDRRGRVIGVVTSCAMDSDGYQTGLVYLKEEHSQEGTPLLVLTGGLPTAAATPRMGDKVSVPDTATVLTRFPVKQKPIVTGKSPTSSPS